MDKKSRNAVAGLCHDAYRRVFGGQYHAAGYDVGIFDEITQCQQNTKKDGDHDDRLLYDALLAHKADADKWQSLPHPFKMLVESCLKHLETRFSDLDKPTTAYQSPYFERISEKQHWEKRTKAYQYIV
jgi:hypothetical protein